MKRTTLVALSVLAIALVLGITSNSQAGSKVIVGHQWAANERVKIDQIDHRPWDSLLQKHVDAQGMVNYAAWKASPGDLQALDAYLASLSRALPSLQSSRAGQLAFWINAYNAVTVRGILREYPTSSIRNHTAKVFGYNIWDDLLLVVGDQKISLNDMEHKILRKMGEPRIHFAIVCASIGCPTLSNRAFMPQTIDGQLTSNAQSFFADPEKFQYDVQAGRIRVSPILKWFAEDFGANAAAQMAAIAPYLPGTAAQQLARSGRAQVSYLDYDWNLNDLRAGSKTVQRR